MFHVKQLFYLTYIYCSYFMSPKCHIRKGECMNTKIKLNQRQLTLLMSNLLITKMTFSFPRFLFKTSGNGAWIQAIYMSLLAYVILRLSLSFFKHTGNKSILSLSESLGKKPLKIAVSLLIAFIIIVHTTTEMRKDCSSAQNQDRIYPDFLWCYRGCWCSLRI